MSASAASMQNLPPHLDAAFQAATAEARRLEQLPYTQFGGGRLAVQDPDIIQAKILSNQTGSYAPALFAARQQLQAGSQEFPENYRRYMNPYEQHVVDNIERKGQRILTEKMLPELDARFIGLGQHGSSRHAKLAREAARDVSAEIAAQQGDAMSRGYENAMQGFNYDKARQLEAAAALTKLGVTQQATKMADIEALQKSGLMTQDQAQRALDLQYEQFKERQRFPYEQLSFLLSALQANPVLPSTYTRRDVPGPAQSMHSGGWQNAGMGILGDLLFGRR
jgi:hypothetical protein